MAFLFFGSLTIESCNSAIFFILPSMSIFWNRLLVWFFSSLTVSSFPSFFAKREAQAECMAVTQFSRSVWLVACETNQQHNIMTRQEGKKKIIKISSSRTWGAWQVLCDLRSLSSNKWNKVLSLKLCKQRKLELFLHSIITCFQPSPSAS